MLREESGSGDDSPDSSSQSLRPKPRHPNCKFVSSRNKNFLHIHNSSSGDHNGNPGGSSAAARSTAGSLGSLHDLATNENSYRGGNSSSRLISRHRTSGGATAVSARSTHDPHHESQHTADGHQRVSARARAGQCQSYNILINISDLKIKL